MKRYTCTYCGYFNDYYTIEPTRCSFCMEIISQMYKPKHFKLYELFPKNFYNTYKHKENHLLWLLDDRILWTNDQLRERYGPVYINNWYWGGNNQYGGYRSFNCPIGAKLSQHKTGRACDLKFKEITAEAVRKDIFKDPFDPIFEYITCVETGISWFHYDVRNWDKLEHGILKIQP